MEIQVHNLSPAEIQSSIQTLSPQQIMTVIAALNEKFDPAWQEKLIAAIKGLSDFQKLEAAGKALSFRQAQEILDSDMAADKSELWKLSPLFVGMPHAVFTQFLRSASPLQMQIFKQEAMSEPLQHHLTVLIHEILHQIPLHADLLADIENSLNQIDVRDLSREEISFISNKINRSQEYYESALQQINKMLILAWNSNRIDLIEKLSQAKETCQKFIQTIIGQPEQESIPASGLYAKLQDRLTTIFGNSADPGDHEALNNDEPAIEALAKFSIWYPKDYWEIGLLPTILDPLLFNRISENMRDQLLHQVKENLQKIGLNTVADLKNLGIFSKKILQEYIQHNQHLLR